MIDRSVRGMPKEHTAPIWQMETKLPDGHRIFLDYHSGRWAIADDSGHFPNDTDDGVLWLDTENEMSVIKDDSFDPPRESIFLPLVNDAGERFRAVIDAATMLFLARRWNWAIIVEPNAQPNGPLYYRVGRI